MAFALFKGPFERVGCTFERDGWVVHGRYSGALPKNWVVADIVRIKDGVLAEHWDVIQDEATKAESKSGLPMFGETFTG